MELRLSNAAAIALIVVVAHVWAGFLAELSSAARFGPPHCGTPFVNLFLQMLFATAASSLVGLWVWWCYRRSFATSPAGFRFLARLPATILAALLLAFWGMLAFMALT
jgi:hypothetical protein